MNIGEKIKFLRKEKRLTQKQLADLIHKSEITVRKYESNDISVTFDVLLDIINVLGFRFSIERNNDSDILRQYIESKNINIDEKLYKEMETFINEYVEFKIYKSKKY